MPKIMVFVDPSKEEATIVEYGSKGEKKSENKCSVKAVFAKNVNIIIEPQAITRMVVLTVDNGNYNCKGNILVLEPR